MDKKQLKQERIRGYFVDAACDIIENEGLHEASVRKVADRAGYHYTTLYAHFDDFSHVVHFAILRFLSRVMGHIDAATAGITDPLDQYKRGWLAYLGYMLDHPNIARVVVVERIQQVPDELLALVPENPLVKGQVEFLSKCVEAGCIPRESARDVSSMIFFVCSGCAADSLSGRSNLSTEERLRVAEAAIDAVLASVRTK